MAPHGPPTATLEALKTAAFFKEMQKQAVGPVLGLLGHLGTNVAGRAAHHASNLAEVLAHRGFQHGATGSKVAPGASRALKLLLGPEALNSYEAARAAGQKMYALPPEKRTAAIKALSEGAERLSGKAGISQRAGEIMHEAPIVGSLQRAAQHELAGTAPELQAHGSLAKAYSRAVDLMSRLEHTPFQTPIQRAATNVVGAAPAVALAAADPSGAAVHMGWNAAREAIAKSKPGKEYMKGMLRRGLAGDTMSPTKEMLYDIGASPAFLTPHRLGRAIREAGMVDPARTATQAIDEPVVQHLLRGMASEAPTTSFGEQIGSIARGLPVIGRKVQEFLPSAQQAHI